MVLEWHYTFKTDFTEFILENNVILVKVDKEELQLYVMVFVNTFCPDINYKIINKEYGKN